MKARRREMETLSLSFLDAMCCGLGAIILLLVIVKMFEPIRLEESNLELEALLVQYTQELAEIVGETDRVQRQELEVVLVERAQT